MRIIPRLNMRKLQIGNDIAGKEIQRLWGDVLVVDAKHDLRVFITPDDLKEAKRQDPACCVFARACQRSFGAKRALFFRSVAYVELPDDHGVHRVERFSLNQGMRKLIEDFDKGLQVIPKAGFLLKTVAKARQLNHRARVEKRRGDSERRRRRRLLGKSVPNHKDTKYQDSPLVIDMVRSGSGAVHFARAGRNK